MKIRLFLLLAVLALATGCQKTDCNGDLDGMWQLTSLKTTEQGQTLLDKNDSIFWSFQLQLMKVEKLGHYPSLCTFRHTGDSLFVLKAYLRPNDILIGSAEPAELTKEDGTKEIGSGFGDTRLKLVGMSESGKFRVLALDGDAMVLSRGDSILTFRKF